MQELFTPVRFSVHDRVEVSIVVRAHDDCRKTWECLQSIKEATSGPLFEVIVVDDGSSDGTPEMLRSGEGITGLRNEQTLGLIASWNRGAALARGEYLVFLTNDTRVTPGWLTALAQTFHKVPGTGLAGAKLMLPNGRLQEAGAAIWRDASRSSYGKFDDGDHPSYNFAREVDCCSGACLMVPRALFHFLGGFDSDCVPACCGETDLAFKIRHAGHKVIYQPLAKVVHQEVLAPGASVAPAIKSDQQAIQSKFRERWRDRLDWHPDPAPGLSRIVHAHGPESVSQGQVLVIDHRLPTPDRDSGSFRMMEIMRGIMRRGHHVALLPDNMMVFAPYLQELQTIGVEVAYPPHYRSVAEYLEQHGREFNLVIISRADVADRHMTTVRQLAPQAKIVFDTVDLHFLREERLAHIKQNPALQAAVASRKEQELRLARTADLTLVVSPIEKAILEEECHNEIDVRIMTNIHPVGETNPPGFNQRRSIVFIGGFDHAPNIDAVLYFASEIFPRVRERIPRAVFQVIGPYPTPEIRRIGSRRIQILDFVPDVKPIFDQARVSVAPLRIGAGVKGKVNLSMSLGVPTVVTSIAAEGMYLIHERDAMVADDPESFANAVVRLWSSRELWERVSTNGLRSLREHFSVEAAAKPIDELLEWAGLAVPGRSIPWPEFVGRGET